MRPIALIIAAEFFATGSVLTGVFHGLSAGKIGHPGAFGRGVARVADPASSAKTATTATVSPRRLTPATKPRGSERAPRR